jgi:hypothetical protein
MTKLFFLTVYFWSFHCFSQAVLVEENGQKLYSTVTRSTEYLPKETYSDTFDFKTKNRVGVGFGFSGIHGLMGLQLELNFFPELAVVGNYGFSDGFQSFGFNVKRTFTGKYFSAYVSGGFTRWFSESSDGPIGETQPSYLATRFLNNQQISQGLFYETLIYPSIGLQYIQLDGEWARSSIYAEVTLLVDPDEFQSAATGSLGYLFYF